MTAGQSAAPPAYRALEDRFRRISLVKDALRFLHWDMAVMMPPGGAAARGEQIAALRLHLNEMLAAPELADLIAEAAAQESRLDPWQRANLHEMRRRHFHEAAVPSDLVVAHARACVRGEMAWREARRKADFEAVLPAFADVLDLTRAIAAAKGEALGLAPYDALLDLYEPGARAAAIEPLFEDYVSFLPRILEGALARQEAQPAPEPPVGSFSIAIQRRLCRRLAAAVGVDFSSARLDETHHPFSSGVPEDSRIAVRYDENDVLSGVMATLHEAGHAMYERGRPATWRQQPVGEARGMVLHESQSLIVEMQAGRSRAFLGWLAPRLRTAFAGRGAAWESDNIRRLVTRVERGFIRVEADEVTYPAHVVLRFRLERAMLAGELEPRDLPVAWREGLDGLLGVVPPDDRQGCLQDVHWYGGDWGYFPTYTLGAMAAAQLFRAACAEDGDIVAGLGRGDFRPLMAWLRARVHELASLYGTDEVLRRATGRPLTTEAFKAHLTHRYLEDG